uniref:Uncharacterized protein n=1 Tax=Strigamia maritima TaxID=126957 RepID=T1JEN3_STRMM
MRYIKPSKCVFPLKQCSKTNGQLLKLLKERHLLKGEKLLDTIDSVEDTKGNSCDRGQLLL